MYARYVKRVLDFVCSLMALILLSPVFLVVAILVKCDSKGPIFFKQDRLGKDGKIFKILKFRTMIVNAENIGDGLKIKAETDSRITRVGRILRKTSLDELPQLINVFWGDMSLIGPRPPVTYHPYKYEEYSNEQKLRFKVRPGITGLAQARVRNNATWDERIIIDIEYVNDIKFLTDVKIIFDTIVELFKKEDLYLAKEEIEELKEKSNV